MITLLRCGCEHLTALEPAAVSSGRWVAGPVLFSPDQVFLQPQLTGCFQWSANIYQLTSV